MPLRLEFPDKYRLWSDLLHGSTDRLFVPTSERPQLGSRVSVELALAGAIGRMVTEAVMVGVRHPGGRFPAGVFLHFPREEIEKCRRFLGLSVPGGFDKGRKTPRVRCALPVQFVSVAADRAYEVRNLSESGLLCTAPAVVREGERLRLLLTLDDGDIVPVEAEVSWTRATERLAGLRFVDPPAESRRLIAEAVRRLKAMDSSARKLRPSIVVAEDDVEILVFLTTALSRRGYDVHAAQRGDEALALIRELLPEMVLLDILMPGIDGVDLCRMMRADVDMSAINVIFLSALEEQRLHAMANDAGATDYVSKPVNLTRMFEVIGQYLRK